jgi:hypothetical protein
MIASLFLSVTWPWPAKRAVFHKSWDHQHSAPTTWGHQLVNAHLMRNTIPPVGLEQPKVSMVTLRRGAAPDDRLHPQLAVDHQVRDHN